MTDSVEEEPRRVSTIELFLDLVFVFAVTQLTALLAEHPDLGGLLQSLLIFGVVWWIYGGYVWLTNAVAPDTKPRRFMLLVAMLGFLLIALAIPTTFGAGGLVFGLGYLLVVVVHAVTFTMNADTARWTGILTIAPLNVLSAVLILVGGVVGGVAQYPLLALALGVQVVTPFLVRSGQFRVNTAHFVERYGLLVLIVLGESIVAIGVGLGSDTALDLPLLTAAALALAITSVLWWIYFSGEDARAEEAMEREPDRRARIAINAFFYATIPMLLGVVVFAAGVHFAIAHAFQPLDTPAALALAGGPALYLLGDVIFRLFIGSGVAWNRILAAGLAVGAVPIGISVSAVAELAVVWVILVVSVLAPAMWADRAERGVSHALE